MKHIPIPIRITVGLVVALVIRLLLVPNPGFEADISFWKSWGLAVVDFGLVKGLPLTNFNYPTPFGYFLGVLVWIYKLFLNPHNFNEFWKNNNLLFLFIAKFPAILADFGIAGVFFYIGKHAKKIGFPDLPLSFYTMSAFLFLFNPVALIDGAWWGQLDSLGVLLFLLSLLLLLQRRSFWAGVVYMISMMTKLQNMIYGPIFFVFLWQMTGWDGFVAGVSGAILTFIGSNIEFILAHNVGRVIISLTGNYDYFPYLSLNAFNPWWIWSGAAGMKGSDKVLALGLVSAKNLGLYLFSAGYLVAVLFMKPFSYFQDKIRDGSDTIYRFLTAFLIVNGAFFLLETESHDRYAFPFVIILLLWSTFAIRRKLTVKESLQVFTSKPWYTFLTLYVVFSLLYFYNLHTALVLNYPHNGIPMLSGLTGSAATLTVAYLFTGLFLWFLLSLSAETNVWTYSLPTLLVILAVTTKNLPLFTKKPIYITDITPVAYEQDYGTRMVNMPVSASLSVKNWSSLSVQYAFYRHGIGTHANGYQTYDIGGLFKTFSFDYGVDTEAGPKGSVTFEVWGDGKQLFASKKIGRYDYPRHADVNVLGVHTLKLVVTDAGDGITDDHADWLNAKLYEQ